MIYVVEFTSGIKATVQVLENWLVKPWDYGEAENIAIDEAKRLTDWKFHKVRSVKIRKEIKT